MKKILFSLLMTGLTMTGLLNAQTQTLTVTGKVVSESGSPITGVTVTDTSASKGTMTDQNGEYSIQAQQGDTLAFSFIGYEKQLRRVTGERINVVLHESFVQLDEVVVVDSRVQKEMSFTGSVSVAVPRGRMESVAVMAFDQSVRYDRRQENEEYASIHENRFIPVEKDPLSTFSLEVDGASYANVRRMISQGQLPPADAVRVEEMVNYFSYDYETPDRGDPLKISYEISECPWNKLHRLVRIGVKAREIPSEELPQSNFVFLIDVSGSMYGPTRLELVKSSLKLLVNNLREEDKVSIVVYAGAAGVVLPATSGSDKQKIREALDNLTAGGSTAGGAGIQLAYRIARQNFIVGGNNRIILCTDGDFNVGVSSTQGLESLIEQERKSGVFLTVLGYGMGNYKDNRMQVLAEKGNGNHAYIDNIQEANRVLVNEFGGTMHTVAKDVKLQIEFNPAKVQSYRLVGYESRLLAHEDFNDDTKDAGEIGAGHSVTALYEVVPVGVGSAAGRGVDPLKYQTEVPAYQPYSVAGTNHYPDLMTIKLRYKEPDGTTSRKMEVAVVDNGRNTISEDFRFAASVAMFGQLLRDSDFKGTATYEDVIALARQGLSEDEHGYRREFVRLAESVGGMVK